MRDIPVYKTPDGSYAFLDNGTIPTPFHLLKPEVAFGLASNIPQELRDILQLSFVDLRGDGSVIMLYQDTVDPICARIIGSDGGDSYISPKGAFELLSTREKVESGELSPKEHLAEQIGLNTTPLQAAANMQRYQSLIAVVQALVSQTPVVEFYAALPGAEHAAGEVGFTYTDEANFFEDEMPLLVKACELADTLGLEHSEVEGQHRAYFTVSNCNTYDQRQALKKGAE